MPYNLKKLLLSPGNYFLELLRKRNQNEYVSPKYAGNKITYSVVSAVYNVAPYLDKFITSIVEQSFGFKDHIEIILVDDGSTDPGAEIAGKWVGRYPNNIKLIQKENDGQASARNLGLKHVRGEWVIFIDPDDWVSDTFFSEIDSFLYEHFGSFDILAAKLVLFYEETGEELNTHPLGYRFDGGNKVLDLRYYPKYFQMSVSSAFFQVAVINQHQIVFDEKLRPNFEDAKFILDYLRSIRSFRIGFCPWAKYYYRKRVSGDSTLDKSFDTSDILLNKSRRAYIKVFEEYIEAFGFVPDFLQQEVLYDICWSLMKFIGKDRDLPVLSNSEIEEAWELFRKAVSYISPEIIENTFYGHLTPEIRFGLLNVFQYQRPKGWGAILDHTPTASGRLSFSLTVTPEESRQITFISGGKSVEPTLLKRNSCSFLKRPFYDLIIAFLPSNFGSEPLSIFLGKEQIPIFREKRKYECLPAKIKEELEMRQTRPKRRKLLQEILVYASQKFPYRSIYKDGWLFIDRDVQADDNAEHLYRYIMGLPNKKRPNSFFILNRDSHDWGRLKKEGFRLLRHGSFRHHLAVLNAKWIVSSQADLYVEQPLRRSLFGDKLEYKFAFLQHGVTHNDLSGWLNAKRFALFVCATRPEYESFLSGNYKLSKDELVLTGLPRHDRLGKFAKMVKNQDLILVMPTWRQYLLGAATGIGNARSKKNVFKNTEYYRAWQLLLNSNEFIDLSKRYGLQIVFFPHINMQPYLKDFSIPPEIRAFSHHEGSMQNMFAQCALLLTDYSSVAFDTAFINRPVVYYQFDADTHFSSHLTKKGYFDYHRDGFGPVASKHDDLLRHINEVLDYQGQLPPQYQKRRDRTFPELKISSCEAVFRELVDRSC